MYIAKIPGTKYIASLESEHGQWLLRLKLEDVIEAETPIEQMTKKAIHSKLGELFSQVNLDVNSFQHDLIHEEIISQITHMLEDSSKSENETRTPPATEVPKEDPRVDNLLDKVQKLEDKVEMLQDRLERMETLSSS